MTTLFEEFTESQERGSAIFSPCGKYRYSLLREWDDTLPRVVFLMLNPSTADAEKNDPTVARCVKFAKAWRYGSLEVLNLFAYRSTDPKALYDADDPIGPENNEHMARVLSSDAFVVCAWGEHGSFGGRYRGVIEMARRAGKPLHCLCRNQSGHPKHPLYCKGDLQPMAYPFAVEEGERDGR